MKQYLILILVILGFRSVAQVKPTYDDAGSWNTLNLDYAISKKATLVFTQELRIKENYSRLNLLYSELGVDYSIHKLIKTSLVYRFTQKYLDENWFGYRHRFTWDLNFKYKFSRITLGYRNRIQTEYRNLKSSDVGTVPEWYLRCRGSISYQLNKKLSPYFNTEFRYQLRDARNIESEHTWHRVRYQAGLDYKVNNFSKLGIYYLVQREFNSNTIENQYITGLEYSVSLRDTPLFKKDKKKNKKKKGK
jgi:opacity protein-like surface antigen